MPRNESVNHLKGYMVGVERSMEARQQRSRQVRTRARRKFNAGSLKHGKLNNYEHTLQSSKANVPKTTTKKVARIFRLALRW